MVRDLDAIVFCFNENDLIIKTALQVKQDLQTSGHEAGLAYWARAVKVRGPFLELNPVNISSEIIKIPFLKKVDIDIKNLTGLSDFLADPSMELLFKIKYKNGDAGGAVANYIVRYLRDSKPKIKKLQKLSIWMLLGYCEVFENTRIAIRNYNLKICAIYQGNWLNNRAVLDAANYENIKVLTYGESDIEKYWISQYDLYQLSNWYKFPFEDYFKENKWRKFREVDILQKRQDIKYNIFAKRFKIESVSTNYDVDSENVIFFTSNSDIERFGLSNEWTSSLGSQIEVIQLLIKICKKLRRKLIIRIHPNQNNQSKAEQIRLFEILKNVENQFIIDANSTVNSYSLAAKSSRNLVYVSNIAIELASIGIPVAAFAPSSYSPSKAVPIISNPKDLEDYIKFGFSKAKIKRNQVRARAWISFLEKNHYRKFKGDSKFISSKTKIRIEIRSIAWIRIFFKILTDRVWLKFKFYEIKEIFSFY